MKKLLLLLTALAFALSSCCGSRTLEIVVSDEVANAGYIGNGAEWDPYDEAESWGSAVSEEDWAKLYERLDYMRMGYVRCMINSPFRYYDAETGSYDRERNSESLLKLLDYCQKNGIYVIYGEYNPPTWDMKDSQKWVEWSVDYLNWLVQDLGFDCIRQFVIFNEPDGNWASTNGDYDLWLSMAKRFDAEMAKYEGLKDKVMLAGPDVVMNYRNPASLYDAEGWVAQTARDIDHLVGVYDVHAYLGQTQVRNGTYAEMLRSMKAQVPEGKKIVLGEAGYKYSSDPADSLLWKEYRRRCEGHPYTKGSDCNMLVYDYFYGLDMPLLAMEAMNSGFSGLAVWMLDDSMHSNGDSGRTEDIKLWGMWNILGEEVFGDASQEEIRPWYYSWALMCRYFPSGCDVLKISLPETDGVRAVAACGDSGVTVAIVNTSDTDYCVSLSLPQPVKDAALYLYQEGNLRQNEAGHPLPVKEGLCGDRLKVELPAQTFVLMTEMD